MCGWLWLRNACRLPFAATRPPIALPCCNTSAICLAGWLARVTRPGGRVLIVEPDNAARYWFSSVQSAGREAFEISLRLGRRHRRPLRLAGSSSTASRRERSNPSRSGSSGIGRALAAADMSTPRLRRLGVDFLEGGSIINARDASTAGLALFLTRRLFAISASYPAQKPRAVLAPFRRADRRAARHCVPERLAVANDGPSSSTGRSLATASRCQNAMSRRATVCAFSQS